MNMETIQQALVHYGPWMVIGVAVVSLGLFAVVFAAFVMNEWCFKRKDAHSDHGQGHGGHH